MIYIAASKNNIQNMIYLSVKYPDKLLFYLNFYILLCIIFLKLILYNRNYDIHIELFLQNS